MIGPADPSPYCKPKNPTAAASRELNRKRDEIPTFPVSAVSVLATVVNLAWAQFIIRTGKREKSLSLVADGKAPAAAFPKTDGFRVYARKAIDGGCGPADPAVREAAETVAILLSLVAPYTAEEMWERLGHEPTVARAGWPTVDPALRSDDDA